MYKPTSLKRELLASALKASSLRVFAAVLVLVSLVFATSVIPTLSRFTGTEPQKVSAATNSTLNFQARLQNAAGNIAPDGSYNVEFKLYSASSGGSALWTEDYLNSATQGVTVKNGYLTVNLGSITALPTTINYDQDLYLTMTVRGTGSCAFSGCTPADAEMSPRLKLTASAYAFRAGQLAQFNSSTGFTSSLSIVQPTGGNQSFQIQDQGAAGTYNLLTQNQANSSYIQLQSTTPGTAQTGNFNITGKGILNQLNATTVVSQNFYGDYFDTGGASTLYLGTNNTNSILLGKFGMTTQVQGTFDVEASAIIKGSLTLQNISTPASFTTPAGTTVATLLKVPLYDPGAFNQVIALGLPNSANSNARVISVFDARSTVHQPTIAVFSPNETDAIGFSWDGSDSTGKVTTVSGDISINPGAHHVITFSDINGVSLGGGRSLSFMSGNGNFDQSNSTGTFMTGSGAVSLNGNTTLASGKTFTVQGAASFQNVADSTTALTVKNAAGTSMLAVDTTNSAVNIGASNINLVAPTGGSYESIWANDVPTVAADSDPGSTTAGVKFRATADGTISGIRFYKGNNDAGTYTGGLYNTGGTLLRSASFTPSAGFGWKQVTFSTPVSITAGTTYVAAYYTPGGHYAFDAGYLTSSGHTNGHLTALQTGVDGGNGVYNSGGAGITYPASVSTGNNLWVDVLYTAGTGAINTISSGNDLGINTGGGLYVSTHGPTSFKSTIGSATAFAFQNAAGTSVLDIDTTNNRVGIGTVTPGYTLDVQGGQINSSGGYRFNGTNGATTSCSGGQLLSNQVVQGGIVTGGTCAAGGVTTVGTIDTGTYSADGASISGSTIYLQAATATHTGLVTSGTQTFGGDKTFNGNVSLAATQTITMVGNTTANRPTGAEGRMYFDTSTKQLLIYANGKWQADRTEAVIVAASNSSQADKDAADYVADGNTGTANDGDQVQINAALTAASGRKVVLLAGTYVADATILIPNNTTFAGVGQGTVIQLADLDATDNLIENTDQATGTGVVIQDMRLDGQDTLNTAGTQYGIYLDDMGDYTSSRTGSVIRNVRVENFRSNGIFYWSSDGNVLDSSTLYGMDSGGATLAVYFDSSSRNNTITHNVFTTNGYAIRADGSGTTNNSFGDNVFRSNSYGIYLYGATNTIVSGNNFDGTTNSDVVMYSDTGNTSTYNNINGNTSRGAGNFATASNTSNNEVTNNRIHDSGTSTNTNAIQIDNDSDSNTVTGNVITDSSCLTNCYAITITSASAGANYLANNTLGTGSVNDAGTGTIYAGQVNNNGYFGFRATTTRLGIGTVSPAYALDVTGDVSSSTTFRIGATAGLSSLTCSGGQLLQNATVLGGIVTGGSCVAAGGGGGISIVGALDGGTANATGATISGSTIYLQSASASYAGLINTTTQTFAGTKTFSSVNVNGALYANSGLYVDTINSNGANGNTVTLNDSLTVAAGKTITMVGNTTANRPTGAEGRMYFDTDTKQLLVYANGKWQADQSEAILVAASNSSQADKDSADYVADGNTGTANDGDQVQINAALTAASGKKVVLLAGTYVADATILIPNNTTLAGAGQGTVIELADLDATDNLIENSDTTTGTGVTIQDMKLDGRSDLNTAGAQNGIYLNGIPATGTGAMVQNVTAARFRTAGIWTNNVNNSQFINNNFQNNASGYGMYVFGGTNNAITGSVFVNNFYGLYIDQSAAENNISGNVFRGSNTAVQGGDENTYASNAFYDNVVGISARYYNTITGNKFMGSATASYGVYLTGGAGNTVTGNSFNAFSQAGANAIYLTVSNTNTISSNTIIDTGGTTLNGAVYLDASDKNIIIGNAITDASATTSNYAIQIGNSTSDNNYLADNTLDTGSVRDLGTGTIFAGQVNTSGYFGFKATTTRLGIGTVSPAYALDVTGDVSSSTTFRIGATAGLSSLTCSGGQLLQNATVLGGIVTGGSCVAAGGGGVSIVGTIDGGTYSDNGASISGSTIYLQTATATHTGLVNYGAQTFGGNKTFSGTIIASSGIVVNNGIDSNGAVALDIGSSFATQINLNKDVVVAAGQSLTITGGVTGSRPTGAEGKMYFDTSTKQLLIYANGKWQADRSVTTKIIAASNSSQAAKDAADVVLTGTGDQTLINTALTAAAGGRVYLLEGTYSLTGAISVPNNTTLEGAGNGTIIRIPNAQNGSYNMITNTDSTTGAGVVIQNLLIDGNTANQTSGAMTGVYINNVGSGTAGTRAGAKLYNLTITNIRGGAGAYAIRFLGANGTIMGNTLSANSGNGLWMSGSSLGNNTISNNTIQGNTADGIILNAASNNTITGNVIESNGGSGIASIATSSGNTITGNIIRLNNSHGVMVAGDLNNVSSNTFDSNGVYSVFLFGATKTTVSSNTISDSGSTTANNAISVQSSTNNSITGNVISDSSATTTNYAINIISGSTNNYLANNTLGTGSISDLATGTVYAGQQDANGYFGFKATTSRLGIGNVSPAYALDVNGEINAVTGFRINGTQGSTVSCTGGQFLQNPVVAGGIITGGTCAAGGGGGVTSLNGLTGALSVVGSSQIGVSAAGASVTLSIQADSIGDAQLAFNTGQNLTTTSAVTHGSLTIGSGGNTITLDTSGFVATGTARHGKMIKISPEFPGAVFYPMPTSPNGHVGYMSSDYDTTNGRNFYSWATDQGTTQDYDIIVQAQLPSDFDGFVSGSFSLYNAVTNTGANTLSYMMKDASGTNCYTSGTYQTTTVSTSWASRTMTDPSGCTFNPNDTVTFFFRLGSNSSAATDYTKLGSFQFNYNSKF